MLVCNTCMYYLCIHYVCMYVHVYRTMKNKLDALISQSQFFLKYSTIACLLLMTMPHQLLAKVVPIAVLYSLCAHLLIMIKVDKVTATIQHLHILTTADVMDVVSDEDMIPAGEEEEQDQGIDSSMVMLGYKITSTRM